MDSSFQAAMNDLVAADAARMSGRDFADARGAGVARRVRTRRTVRAAGMGGTSAVAVGGLAFGAMHSPWGVATVPAVGSENCSAPWPVAYPYVVQHRYADYLAGQWTVLDATSRDIVFAISFDDAGQTWLVTFPSGATEVVPYAEAGSVTVNVPNGPSIRLRVSLTDDGSTEMAVTAYSETPGGPLIAPLSHCYTQGPTPTPNSSVVRPSADPSLAASTERITSPFQCGFVFDKESSDAAHLTVTATAWNTPSAGMSAGENEVDTSWSAVASDQSLSAVHGVVRATVGSDQPNYGSLAPTLVNGMDPADPTRTTNTADSAIVGESFVNVRDGVVVGTMSVAGGDGPRTASAILNDYQFASTLLTPQTAFKACPDAAPSDGSVDVYFVAGALVTGSQGSDVTAGPEYAWAWIGAFSSNGSSISAPTN